MSVSANEALVRRAIDAIWNRGDLDAADEFFADDYVNHYGLIPGFVLGPEAIISAALYRVAFPGLQVAVDDVRIVEDTVVLRWTALEIPPTEIGAGWSSGSQPISSQGSRARASPPGRSSRVGPNGIGPLRSFASSKHEGDRRIDLIGPA